MHSNNRSSNKRTDQSTEQFSVETPEGRRTARGVAGDQGGYYGRQQNDRGPGANNYGSSKYGGSDYESYDYGSHGHERSNYGGPYTEQHNDHRYEADATSGADHDIAGRQRDRLSPTNTLWRAPSAEYSAEHSRRPHADTGQSNGARSDQPSHYGRGPKGYVRSDERLQELVCERLADAHDIDASDITVQVKDREVTLQGSVSTRRIKHAAENVAADVHGVADVINQLKVHR